MAVLSLQRNLKETSENFIKSKKYKYSSETVYTIVQKFGEEKQ